MASRLILFSGGVESTALLTMSDPKDFLLIVEPPWPDNNETFNRSAVEEISSYFKLKTHYAQIKIDFFSKYTSWSHQIVYIFSVCHIFCSRYPEVKEVWYGLHRNEMDKEWKENLYRKKIKAWNFLFPDIPFYIPLIHLTKREQWGLIPDEIKPKVRSCIHDVPCGKCLKCLEFQNM
jgi:7-cyano-7-deazaguanine synthase in queuosine biosynthesis